MTLKELQTLIDKANFAYYTTGNAIMDDVKYEKLKEELKRLNPNDSRFSTVGASVRDTILQKKSHSIRMGSLDKCQDQAQWENKWIKNILAKNGLTNETLFASYKMDGGSLSIEYKNGKLVEAIGRGDGIIGEDLTANAMAFKGLPLSNNGFTGFVRGEMVVHVDDFDKLQDKAANPRSAATGISRRKNGSESESITFYAFKAYDSNGISIADTESDMHRKLKSLGFNTVDAFVGTAAEVWDWKLKVAKIRPTLNFWIDGIVVSINNIKKQLALGESSNCPNGMMAVKFEAEAAQTVLEEVTFEVGHSGALTPVGKFKPCQIGGTTVTYASLYNFDNIENLDLAINDTIEVIKANDIIPVVSDVLKRPSNRISIKIPTHCPICNNKVEKKSNVNGTDSVAIYCVNDNCASQITGKIEKYVKSLDIQGCGGSVIEALVNDGLIKDASDLYLLHHQTYALNNLVLSDKVLLGAKRAGKILEEIEKKRKLPLNEFIGSLGIDGLGKRRVAIVQEALKGKMDSLTNWLDGTTLIKYANESSLPNAAIGINDELIKKKNYILKFIKNGLMITESKKSHLKDGAFTFVLTGKFSVSKEILHAKIEQAGHGYSDTYSKSTTYLVTADSTSTSSKMEKARKNGTKIINEAELIALLK